MEYLSFRHGKQYYAVPIESVRFITADHNLDRTRVATGNGNQYDMVDFDGQSCVVLSLANLLGEDSAQRATSELVELLFAREQDHVDWLDTLEQSLISGTAFTADTDQNLSAFGQWCRGFRSDNLMLQQLLAKFDTPHRRIYALAEELLDMRNQGENDAAIEILNEHKRTTLVRLQTLFTDARNMISSSVRPTVIMIQSSSDQVIGLKVDDIGEVFSCRNEQQDLSADEFLPVFALAWLKDIELSDGKTTVMQLDPKRLMH
jgi:chemotaxis signal transduction protein